MSGIGILCADENRNSKEIVEIPQLLMVGPPLSILTLL